MVAGIHHITLITRKVQANVDFYVGFLGLRLVKRTGGFEDATQLHLIYGDATGSPGSLVTFLVWEDGSPGRAGVGQVGEISLAIDPASIGFWLTRALSAGLKPEGPSEEFGEPVLRLKDPDGVIVKLVGTTTLRATAPWTSDTIPQEHAIARIRGATLFTETPEETQAILNDHFGYRPLATSGAINRLVSETGDILDIRDARGFWASAPGTGTVDHVAFRAKDDAELQSVRTALQAINSGPTAMHDRKYFRSLYVREPGQILLELATDAPGMLIDEDEATLGTRLFAPGDSPRLLAELNVILPQFSMPGEPRFIYRDLPFIHRFFTPEQANGNVFVLLHGSGANETTMLPLGHKIDADATLLTVRGRALEEGAPRWFRRNGPMTFDQADIASEAEAFAAFIDGAVHAYGLDPDRIVYIGYSNGANLLNAMLSLQPHLIRRAVLLRSMAVLENPPAADMSDADVLVVAGEKDLYGPYAQPLAERLRDGGAKVDLATIPGGHEFDDADVPVIQAWLKRSP
ncbi:MULTISPECIES: VOC family protein [unclassified Rhizobium]|jgi:phospholipase/carboxylesterase|uniref:VOC family protein n=1 Tax=unclassified Rhizobium TaxID=2613769 RepID=UPI000648AAE6|nr:MULTISPECIES: VOC family protein [unclassified Rhizobium]MBN8949375.1 VOC family protein [Rhizobium tropici]OJY75173.1 MAG: ring-cleaving dioxygenase [Rhizobium sp. 60-20]RKD70841.1 phospholipase/carboxylesterase [Rhizobium sp. WW_1]